MGLINQFRHWTKEAIEGGIEPEALIDVVGQVAKELQPVPDMAELVAEEVASEPEEVAETPEETPEPVAEEVTEQDAEQPAEEDPPHATTF